MDSLRMELRSVEADRREIVGVVVPYDQTSYLVPIAGGERIKRGAFARSIDHRGASIPLYRNHDHSVRMGLSTGFLENEDGLVGTFRVNEGELGDALLDECRNGYYGGLSAGFQSVRRDRGADGASIVAEGKLEEVSVTGLPAYAGAGLLSVRNAEDRVALLAPFRNPPAVNLDPIPPIRYGPR